MLNLLLQTKFPSPLCFNTPHTLVCLSVCMSVRPSVHLPIHLSVFPSIHANVCPSVCLYVHSSDWRSACWSVSPPVRQKWQQKVVITTRLPYCHGNPTFPTSSPAIPFSCSTNRIHYLKTS